MARPRKPTAIKKMQGTLQPCRTNKDEPIPQYSLSKIEPPNYLSDLAKELWTFAIEQAPEELLTSLDFSVFAIWADTQAKIIKCENIIKDEGLVTYDDKGTPRAHPMFRMQNELKQLLRGYLTELGFTPASRSKVSIRKKEDKTNDFIDI